jgi:flagellar biosynthesis/type III secretory pathway ATPase
MEQLGNSAQGSITALISILVDGDDMNEPVTDAARSILDGHIVLKREIAEMNHYPAIDILASISRLAQKLAAAKQNESASCVRRTMALFREIQDLVQIGAYKKGAVRATDVALECMPLINEFLQQGEEKSPFAESLAKLIELAAVCQSKVGKQ